MPQYLALICGPTAGLARMEQLDGLDAFHLWHAASAEAVERRERNGRPGGHVHGVDPGRHGDANGPVHGRQ